MESNVIKWEDKISFLGMSWRLLDMNTELIKVRVSIDLGGVYSEGEAKNLDEAIGSAARKLPFDWFSVEKRITEHNWKSISHL
jgi:hypothetical protein